MTITGSTSSVEWGYKLEVSEVGTNVQNRTSTIEVKTYLGRTRSRSYIGGDYTNTASITGASTQSTAGNIPYPTYINAGEYIHLKTFTFTVPNAGNPTIVTISSELKDTSFSPSYGSASGNMQLTILHLNPEIGTADMVETNSVLIALNVPDTTIVQYLSKKTITLHATPYDSATIDKYRLRHFNTDYNIPSATTYQSSNIFTTDYTTHDISIGSGKANIIQDIGDTLSGTSTDWVYVDIGGTPQKPNGIPYIKPIIENTSTHIRRLSGSGVALTDNKAVLNFVGSIYKAMDIIGNNNLISELGYKIWNPREESEPATYTPITTATMNAGVITVENLVLLNLEYTEIYYYKIILTDEYGYSATIDDGILPSGVSLWTEYTDRVNFLKLTVGGYNPFEYNESNEVIVGIYDDGTTKKPIYRKVFVDTSSNQRAIYINLPNLNADIVVNAHGWIKSIYGNWWALTNYYVSDTNYSTSLFINANGVLCIDLGSYFSYPEYKIILEYTKTTD